jgi:hypothetical protein
MGGFALTATPEQFGPRNWGQFSAADTKPRVIRSADIARIAMKNALAGHRVRKWVFVCKRGQGWTLTRAKVNAERKERRHQGRFGAGLALRPADNGIRID